MATTYVSNNVNEYTSSATEGITTTYQYDECGNLIAQSTGGSTTTYAFNELNELTAVSGPGLTASYGYDPLGNLGSETVNGATSTFQIDPIGLGNLVASFGADGVLTAHYTYGMGLVSQVSASGGAAYYDFNNIGSTIGITGINGSYINKYNYLPFGQSATVSTSVANAFTFVGRYGVLDDGSGLYQTRARDLDPAIGQFTSNDPLGIVGGDENTRRYAAGRPTDLVDPSGLWGVAPFKEWNVKASATTAWLGGFASGDLRLSSNGLKPET